MAKHVEIIHPDGRIEEGIIEADFSQHGKNANPSYRRDYFEHPERWRARKAVASAVSRGKLIRPLMCEDCGRKSKHPIQAHHEDYGKPLDVRWLCTTCHRKADK